MLSSLFECKDVKEIVNKGYENDLLLVTKTIDKIMLGGQDITREDLVVSKLLGQNIINYKSLFPHVSAAIQLSNKKDKHPSKGDTIKYIYTNSQHKNPLELHQKTPLLARRKKNWIMTKKYKEMILDAAETVLGYFGFDRTLYGNRKNIPKRKWRWFDELRQEREGDINMEMSENPQL